MTLFILGSEDVVLGFQFIGLQGKTAENKDSALKEFNNITNGIYGNIGVLILTEKISVFLEDEILEWQLSGKYPLLVEIPDMEGHLEGKKSLLQSIREAIGLPI